MIKIDKKVIVHETCAYYGIPPEMLKKKKRGRRTVSKTKHTIWYFLRRYSHYSFYEIGDAFDNCHTTICTAFNNFTKKLETDEELKYDVEQIYMNMVEPDKS